jgi:hypothetical protein
MVDIMDDCICGWLNLWMIGCVDHTHRQYSTGITCCLSKRDLKLASKDERNESQDIETSVQLVNFAIN